MKIVIIGAGFTGLTAAFKLSQEGHQVTIFEKEKQAGGLVAGFKQAGWNWSLEYFFHHLFTSDLAAQKLISELGLEDKLFFTRPKTSIFYQGRVSQFDSPFSLLTFPHLSLLEKLRTGIVTLYLKTVPCWSQFEKTTATSWLSRAYGKQPYQILWESLLKNKFGKDFKNISMSWFWARIKKRSPKLGYIEGGFQTLIDRLVGEIKNDGGKFVFNLEIQNLNDIYRYGKFDRVIITTPTPAFFLKLVPKLSASFKTKIQKLEMLGAINFILILKEKFLKDNTYWLNINEPSFPFVAIVEHTNFVDPGHYGGNHLLYVGGYYSQNHRYFKMNKEAIFKEFLPYLKKINPSFDQLSIINYQLSIAPYAQPIIPVNYSKIIPPHQTPIPNVYLANMQQVYPWDRGINYAVEIGEKIAKIISP